MIVTLVCIRYLRLKLLYAAESLFFKILFPFVKRVLNEQGICNYKPRLRGHAFFKVNNKL